MGHDLDAYADLKSERDFERMMRNKLEQLATNLQSELATLKAAHAWIKTSERMPEPEKAVLIVSTEELACVDVCTAKCYISVTGALVWEHYDPATGEAGEDIAAINVTHWQPLPEPPK